MRTTVRLEDELLRQLKEHAVRHNKTLTSVLEEAVRRYLAETGQSQRRHERVSLPTSTAGGGTRPGVDLDDTAALLDLLGDRAAS